MKLLLTGLLLAAAFAFGYGMGGNEQLVGKASIDQLKDEVAKKTLELERHLAKARIRGHLLEMRDALTVAQSQIRHQDFGLAKKALAGARRSLQTALRLDETEAIARLRQFDAKLDTLTQSLTQLGPRALEEIYEKHAAASSANSGPGED